MRFNVFRFAGGFVGGFVWFFAAIHTKGTPSTVFMVLGVIAILIGIKAAWVQDEHQGSDPLE